MPALPLCQGCGRHSDGPAVSNSPQVTAPDQFVHVTAGEAERPGHFGDGEHIRHGLARLAIWAAAGQEHLRPEQSTYPLELAEDRRDFAWRDVIYGLKGTEQIGDPWRHG